MWSACHSQHIFGERATPCISLFACLLLHILRKGYTVQREYGLPVIEFTSDQVTLGKWKFSLHVIGRFDALQKGPRLLVGIMDRV